MKKYILAAAIAALALVGPATGSASAQGWFSRGGPTVVDRLVGNGNYGNYGNYGGYGNYNNFGNRFGGGCNRMNYGNGYFGNNGYNNYFGNNWRHHHHHRFF